MCQLNFIKKIIILYKMPLDFAILSFIYKMITYRVLNNNVPLVKIFKSRAMFKRLLQTHSPYIITEKIKTLYKYYQ